MEEHTTPHLNRPIDKLLPTVFLCVMEDARSFQDQLHFKEWEIEGVWERTDLVDARDGRVEVLLRDLLLLSLYAALNIVFEGRKALQRGNVTRATICAVEAQFRISYVARHVLGELPNFDKTTIAKEALTSLSQKALTVRHAENRAMKNQVFDWCDANMSDFKSMDDAAQHVAGTIVPLKFRAVRAHMTKWKKMRSPGKP